MKGLLQIAAVMALTLGTVGPAAAGEAMMEKDGTRVSLECSNAGCFVYPVKGNAIDHANPIQKLGKGGSKNFKKWERTMRKQGWKTI